MVTRLDHRTNSAAPGLYPAVVDQAMQTPVLHTDELGEHEDLTPYGWHLSQSTLALAVVKRKSGVATACTAPSRTRRWT